MIFKFLGNAGNFGNHHQKESATLLPMLSKSQPRIVKSHDFTIQLV